MQKKTKRGAASFEEEDGKIGSILRFWRLSRGVTQSDLSKAIGVSFQQLQKYESGVNRISADRLVRVSDFLEVPIENFFVDPGSQDKAGIPEVSESNEDKILWRIKVLLDSMSPEQRKVLLSFLLVFVDNDNDGN